MRAPDMAQSHAPLLQDKLDRRFVIFTDDELEVMSPIWFWYLWSLSPRAVIQCSCRNAVATHFATAIVIRVVGGPIGVGDAACRLTRNARSSRSSR